MNENNQKNDRSKNWWKPVILIIIIVTLFLVMNLYGFGQDIQKLQHWIESFGLWGPVAFFIIYIGAVMATIPGTIFGVIAGGLFGSLVGVILISISSTVGASICFLIARYFARDSIAHWLSKNKTMKRLDELTEEQGMMIVGLTRLIPLFPFTLLNYGFGLTKVSFKTYVFWSWLCMLPGTIIVVVGTDVLIKSLTQGNIPWELLGVLFTTCVALGLIVWYSRQRLNEKRKKQVFQGTNKKKLDTFETSMYEQTEKNKESLPTKTFLQNKISEYIEHCIECNKCIDICPVTKRTFSIKDLNLALQEGHIISSKIKEFAFHCMQCGQCVSVCPKDIRRDHMMLYLKYKLRDKKPFGYKRYLLIKGPNKTGLKKFIQQWFIRSKKFTNKEIAHFMETTPEKKADVLFYPGCYIYSIKTIRQTLHLLNHLGCSYTILGGVTTCCGAPHLLQGEFNQADNYQKLLYEKIKNYNPQIILTACAECFEVIEQIKKTHAMNVEVLSVAQYLIRYQDKFPAKKIRGKITLHDSCRFNAQSPQGLAAYEAVSRFGEQTNPPMNQLSSCCYKWNHGNDPRNTLRRANYLAMVKNNAPTLVCNCLTCYEELKKLDADVEIIDVLQLFEEALGTSEIRE